jgi:chromosomal replication initiation ATPase DnaA
MKEHIFTQYLENILKYLDISAEELFEKTKKDEIVKPRQMLFYLCSVKSNMGQKEISGYLKKINQDVPQEIIHYGISTFKKLIEEDKDYVYIIDKLSKINHDVE